MLLAVDVGNLHVNMGLFDNESLMGVYRMTTRIPRTSDEYGYMIKSMLGSNCNSIDGVMIASVVPNVMHSLNNAFIKYFGIEPLILGAGIKTGIKLVVPNPREIGANRIADAVGAFEKYGGPVIVANFGTATTFELISQNREYIAGVTAPGIQMAAKSLWENTAKLPEIEIKNPGTILTKDTVSSMQAGLFYGAVGQAEYIINRLKEESGLNEAKVVATGGIGKLVAESAKQIDFYDGNLTLDGLRIIYRKNRYI